MHLFIQIFSLALMLIGAYRLDQKPWWNIVSGFLIFMIGVIGLIVDLLFW